MNRRIVDLGVLLSALALLAAGCGDISVEGPDDKECLVGATQDCTCTPGDLPGTRSCGDDNKFGDCICVVGQPDADATTTPDEGTPDVVTDEGGPDVIVDTTPDEGTPDTTPPEDISDGGDGDSTVCTPDCGGKECGDDGCGGDCGTCPGAAPVCNNIGLCEVACVPNCENKACGDDGCGGECGPCQGGQQCQFDFTCACVAQQTSNCADGDVYWFDSCGVQGNVKASCNGNGCENGVCLNCTPDCDGKFCGDNGCGGVCGSCSGGQECVNDACVCVAENSVDCVGGDVYWFDSCGTQGAVKETCAYECAGGACQACQPACGDAQCGDDGCGGVCGTCNTAGGESCQGGQCLCSPQSVAQCVGDDVYWFDSCGVQGELAQSCQFECTNGACANCTADCSGKLCGPDGCGGTCGTCDTTGGESCSTAQQCVCEANSQVLCFGSDVYTADSCGTQGNFVANCEYGCQNGTCQPCEPNCAGKQCGDDGCGGVCGQCEPGSGQSCNSNGQCVCEPNATTICIDNDIYAQDSCGEIGALLQKCGNLECVGGICVDNQGCNPGDPEPPMINQNITESADEFGEFVWQSFVAEYDGLLVEIHARPQTNPPVEYELRLYEGPEPDGNLVYAKQGVLSIPEEYPWVKFPTPGIALKAGEFYTFALVGIQAAAFAKGDPYPPGASYLGSENDLSFRVFVAPCQ